MIQRTNIPKASGIYFILSKETDRKYVGSSINLARRKHDHFSAFARGNHDNSYMQGHVNKYGVDDLKFVVIKLCPPEDLIVQEQHYMDSLHPAFNLCPTVQSQLGMHHTDIARKKMSKTAKGRKHTDAVRRKISEATTGQIHSEEAKRKTRESLLKFYSSEEGSKTKRRISEAVKISWVHRKKQQLLITEIRNE